MNRCLVLVSLALCGVLTQSCGYQFAAHANPERVLALEVVNETDVMGLPVTTRRTLDNSGARHGLSFRAAQRNDLHLVRVHIVESSEHPAGIIRESSQTGEDVAMTSWQTVVELRAEWVDGEGKILRTHVARGQATYRDLTLPLATDEARQDAIENAIGVACDELAAWLAATGATPD